MSDVETAPCAKCGTEIPTDAERCSQCGYEPGNSTLSTLAFWLFSLPLGLVFGVLLIAGIAALVTGGTTVSQALGGVIAASLLGAIPFWHIRRYRRRKWTKPTQ